MLANAIFDTSHLTECKNETIINITLKEPMIDQFLGLEVIIGGERNRKLNKNPALVPLWNSFMFMLQLSSYPASSYLCIHEALNQTK